MNDRRETEPSSAPVVDWPGRFVGVAAAVVDPSGRILLVRHTYGRLNWELPGGVSEPGETFEETALRELREETGLDARIERLTGLYHEQDGDAHQLVFRCLVEGNVEPVPSSSEISECGFFPVDALPRPISDFTIRRIHDVVAAAPPQRVVAVPPRTWLD